MILGVLINQSIFLKLVKGRKIPGMNLLAEQSASDDVTIVAFCPSVIDWWNCTINGLVYHVGDNVWKPGKNHFPNVIYDRATFTPKEKQVGNLVRKRFKGEYNIPFLNSKSSFGKWETHKTLAAYPQVKTYLPDTMLYSHPYHLINFLGKYSSVYIKATGGRLGRNIFKVQRLDKNTYTVAYREKGLNHCDHLSLQEIHSMILKDKFLNQKVVIQQGIELACLDDSPFDLRLLVQKNEMGNWEVVDKAVRLATPGSIVTNVSSGGKVQKLSTAVSLVFPETASYLYQEIDSLALKVCCYLEKEYGLLGELGMDMAIEKNGKLWLLEVNGKPAKVSVRRIKDPEVLRRAYSYPVKYARYLFEQTKQGGSPCDL